MLEDDTAFNAAYRALTAFDRSLTVRQVFWIRPIRVRFHKDQLLARQAARIILKISNFNRFGVNFLRAKHPEPARFDAREPLKDLAGA
jgi:hypothetical protein